MFRRFRHYYSLLYILFAPEKCSKGWCPRGEKAVIQWLFSPTKYSWRFNLHKHLLWYNKSSMIFSCGICMKLCPNMVWAGSSLSSCAFYLGRRNTIISKWKDDAVILPSGKFIAVLTGVWINLQHPAMLLMSNYLSQMCSIPTIYSFPSSVIAMEMSIYSRCHIIPWGLN